jgi:predicted membrane protein
MFSLTVLILVGGIFIILFLFALYLAILLAEFYALRIMRWLIRNEPRKINRTPEGTREAQEAFFAIENHYRRSHG